MAAATKDVMLVIMEVVSAKFATDDEHTFIGELHNTVTYYMSVVWVA